MPQVKKNKIKLPFINRKKRTTLIFRTFELSHRQKKYISTLISIEPSKQRKTVQLCPLKENIFCFLNITRGIKIIICKKDFLNTLCIGEWLNVKITKSVQKKIIIKNKKKFLLNF